MKYFINVNRSVEEEYGKMFVFEPGQNRENDDELEVMNNLDEQDQGKPYIFPKSFLMEVSAEDYERYAEAKKKNGNVDSITEQILEKYRG
ncbi:hypothetical protein [Fictibacillus phosphorivorans]|uniref:hypothetical protein n=1 Tax=Fictibacillus phosphorivorans TaxID=1221500 RepID=UPI00203F3F35|nr:hypothetical protein [Fictibacillus phosphorivorans]MCM3718335.1 hypothetical protein [Fictibacillus phosphorivorans]MCM3775959.1 hypothetical protein [Fictibacillus phosphorivorans]